MAVQKTPPRLGTLIDSYAQPRRRRPQRPMSTNRTGNARSGKGFDTEYRDNGDTVHVYDNGERVTVHHDADPEDVSRSLFSSSVKKSSKSKATSDAARKRRARERSNTTTYNPTATLSGNDLRRMVNDLVDAQTRPLLDDLERQRVNTEAQSGRVTANARNYYNDLLARQQQLQTAAQQTADRANASQAAAAGEANAAQTAMAAAAQKAQADDAAVRGDVANIAADKVAQGLADRAQSQANRNAVGAGFIASQGSAGERTAGDMASVLGLKGGEGLQALTKLFAGRLGDIGAKRSEVVEKRGDLRSEILQKLRQQQYDNLVTGQTLGIKQDELDQNQSRIDEAGRHNRAMEKAAMTANQIRSMHNDRQYELDKAKFGASQAKDRYQRRHKLGPYRPGGSKSDSAAGRGLGSLSPAQEQSKLDTIDSIRSLVQSGRKHYRDNWDKVRNALASGQNPEKRAYPAVYIDAAIELERYGHLTPNTAEALRRRGIHISGNFEVGHNSSRPDTAGNPNVG